MARKRKCVVPGCKEPVFVRGQCTAHYHASWRRVKDGETTWAELERLKLSLPDGRQSTIDEAIETARAK